MKRIRKIHAWLSQNSLRRERLEPIYGINRRNVELVYAHNRRRDYPLADDKILCKQHLIAAGVPVPSTLAVCRGLFEVDRTVERLADEQDFVVKPAGGSGGDGILVLGARGERGWSTPKGRPVGLMELRQHLANITFGTYSKQLEDHALIERRIHPHPIYDAFWPDGVCDLRIIVLSGQPILAMVRVPTRRSGGRANLHQGGIGVAVDVASGLTYQAMSQGRLLERHPESQERLVGRKLPDWEACVDIAKRCSNASPLGYLGVDLCVDAEAGPVVLELNVRPGLEIQNVCARPLGQALAAAGFNNENGAKS